MIPGGAKASLNNDGITLDVRRNLKLSIKNQVKIDLLTFEQRERIMPKKNPVELENGRIFSTQKDAIEYFRKILHSPKSKINKEDPEFSDVMSLYKRHPEFEKKSENKNTILYFLIKEGGEYGSRCFHSIHNDGTEADWSIKEAITKKSKTKFECFKDGARNALEQIEHFRDTNFSNKCKLFLNKKGYSIDNIPDDWISEPQRLQYRSTLLNSIKDEFITWYKQQV